MRREIVQPVQFSCKKCGLVTKSAEWQMDPERQAVATAAAHFVLTYGKFGTKSKAPVPAEIPAGVLIDQRTKRPKMDPEAIPEARYVTCGCGEKAYAVNGTQQATA